jgi:hypothetical protein
MYVCAGYLCTTMTTRVASKNSERSTVLQAPIHQKAHDGDQISDAVCDRYVLYYEKRSGVNNDTTFLYYQEYEYFACVKE